LQVATPTGSGKDLLPLAVAQLLKGTSVVFVPFTHLLEGVVAYVGTFGGVGEKFDTARVHNDSAADVVVCSYELAEKAVTLIQNLENRGCLAGIFFNEAHVLDPTLVSYRNFAPVRDMFGNLYRHGVKATVVYMSATLRHPARVLNFCGLSSEMDFTFCKSPMRDNLRFESRLLKGNTSDESHKNIINAAVAAIKSHAADKRVVIFVMFKCVCFLLRNPKLRMRLIKTQV
jgi:hypothetical protein